MTAAPFQRVKFFGPYEFSGDYEFAQLLQKALGHRAEQQRKSGTMFRYKITAEERAALWRKQDGKCAICTRDLVLGPDTHIDHDHNTGKVRGYLCRGCNNGIGHLRDNPEICRAAAAYLEHNK